MRKLIATFLLSLLSAPVLATDDLSCNGEMYTVYMGVGSDNTVGFAAIINEKSKARTEFYFKDIETKKLEWKDSEGDFSKNRLNVVLRDKAGLSFVVEANGRQGVLRQQSKTYKLDCNWER